MKAVLPYLIVFALLGAAEHGVLRYSMTAYKRIVLPAPAIVCPDAAQNPNHLPAPHCWDDFNAKWGGIF